MRPSACPSQHQLRIFSANECPDGPLGPGLGGGKGVHVSHHHHRGARQRVNSRNRARWQAEPAAPTIRVLQQAPSPQDPELAPLLRRTLASFIIWLAISSVFLISWVDMAPLAVKSNRSLSGATKDPLWSASPSTKRRAKLRMWVAVWLLMMGLRLGCREQRESNY